MRGKIGDFKANPRLSNWKIGMEPESTGLGVNPPLSRGMMALHWGFASHVEHTAERVDPLSAMSGRANIAGITYVAYTATSKSVHVMTSVTTNPEAEVPPSNIAKCAPVLVPDQAL
jgi:hypothetical protein